MSEKRIRAAALVAVLFTTGGYAVGRAQASVPVAPRAVYQLRLGIEPMPYRLVTRNCSDAEDSWGSVYTKRFTPEKVVLRCETP